jgi:hypothetical protein
MPMRVQPGPLEQRIDPTAGGSVIKSGGVRKNVPTAKGVTGVIGGKTAGADPTGGKPGPTGSKAAPTLEPAETSTTPAAVPPTSSGGGAASQQGAHETQPPVAKPTPAAAEGATFGARLARGVRVVGGTIIMFALQALGTWLKGRLDELHIRYEIEQLQPTIMVAIQKRADEVAELQVNGSKAYGNVTIGIVQIFAGGISQGLPEVSLDNIAITAREVNVVSTTSPPPPGWTLPWIQRTEELYSFEMKVFTDEELKELDSLSERYMAYDRDLGMPGSVDLKEQMRITREAIVEKFGTKVWLLKLGAPE